MARPPLSMKPTGWFQVAWSDEIGVGDVHRMTYFGQQMVAWRAESGQLTVMNAFCEHLGAHLGFGGKVVGEILQCPFHGWQWSHEGRNVRIPYQDRPNRAGVSAPIRSWSATSRSTSGTTSRPYPSSRRRISSPDSTTAAAPTATTAAAAVSRAPGDAPAVWLENGVDFAHFKYVHNTPIVPVFTRHDFAEPVSFVDFTITFEGDDNQKIEDIDSRVEAINGGLGIAVTKS